MKALPAAATAAPAAQRLFGALAAAHGTSLTLRLRDGRLLAVDASAAYASHRVAEPLFAGKSTVVSGAFDGRGIFHATVVSRATQRPVH